MYNQKKGSIGEYYRDQRLSQLGYKNAVTEDLSINDSAAMTPMDKMLRYGQGGSQVSNQLDKFNESKGGEAFGMLTNPVSTKGTEAVNENKGGNDAGQLAISLGTGALEAYLAKKNIKSDSTAGQTVGAVKGAATGAQLGGKVGSGWGALIGGVIGAGLGLWGARKK